MEGGRRRRETREAGREKGMRKGKEGGRRGRKSEAAPFTMMVLERMEEEEMRAGRENEGARGGALLARVVERV